MKKVININFHGSIIPIEESSYELLKQYIDSLHRFFAQEEGANEIVNDIESRISELFNQRLKAGSTCITDVDVQQIITNIGRPEELEEESGLADEGSGFSGYQQEAPKSDPGFSFGRYRNRTLYRDENNKVLGGVCSGIAAYFHIDPVIVRILFVVFLFTGVGVLLYLLLWVFVPGNTSLQNGVRKRIFRNPDDKIIAGVCSGLGAYFNLNPWVFRILFLIPLFSLVSKWNFGMFTFGPGFIIIYIILSLVIPEAKSTSEKLEMKGERVDLNSIKNSVLQEMKDVGVRVGKMGQEAGAMAAEKGAKIGQDIHQASIRTGGGLGKILATLIKIFVYFILGCIALALIIALFAGVLVTIGLFPLKAFVINDGLQSLYAWGTLIFFIAIPVIGIITFIIRRIGRVRSKSNYMGWTFSGLWFIGWIFLMLLLSSVSRDFKNVSSMTEEMVPLPQPTVQALTLKPVENLAYRRNSWFKIEPYDTYSISGDTALLGNVRIRIKKSATDQFQVSVIKMANGRTRYAADTLASIIHLDIHQQDSVLFVDKGIAINKTDKFRNQQAEVTVYVPVGHRIRIDRSFGQTNRITLNEFMGNSNWYNYSDDREFPYTYNTDYIMQEDGLFTLTGEPASSKPKRRNTQGETPYRYDDPALDSVRQKQDLELQKMQRAVDSAKEQQLRQLEFLKDSLRKVKEEIDMRIERLNASNGHSQEAEFTLQPHNTYLMHI